MVRLDLPHFWAENAASSGKPFSTNKPRCPISLSVDDHWLSDEMKLPSTLRYYRDAEYRLEVHRQCNDRCEAAIGIRPFRQTPAPPPPLRIEQVFGCRMELTENSTPWLEPGVSTPAEMSQLLDRLEKLDEAGLRELVFSTGGRVERQEPLPDGRLRTHNSWSRGPATVGTSVIGTTQYAFWLVDEPALMDRFYEVLTETLVRYHRILGREMNVRVRGFAWLDDNCALLSPPMYERFCFPVMKRVFDEFCPGPEDRRFQHSDSAMAHLLPILSRLSFHGVNFGPTVSAAEIRRHMPRTEIHGQVAPNTVRNGTLEDVVAEVKRDFAAVGADGGLHVTTAGSISAGTSLDSIRGFMWSVQEHTRYGGKG